MSSFHWQHRTKFYPNLCYHKPPGQSSKTSDSYVIRHGTDGMFKTDIKEVWFPGGHTGKFSDMYILAW
jgi:hypothetical protein